MKCKITVFVILLFSAIFSIAQTSTPFVTTWRGEVPIVLYLSGSARYEVRELPNGIVISGTSAYNVQYSRHQIALSVAVPTSNYELKIWYDASPTNEYYFKASSNYSSGLLSVDAWGDTQWSTMHEAFINESRLISVPITSPDLNNVKDLSSMFSGCRAFNGYLNNWDVSRVVDFSNMFLSCELFNGALNSWQVDSGTDFSRMFFGASTFNQSLDLWEMANAENLSYMFSSASAFNQNLNDWDVGSCVDFTAMFSSALTFNQPLNNWNVSNGVEFSSMFQGALAFNHSINDWDVSNGVDFSLMFNRASSFNQPLNNWIMSRAKSMTYMFGNTQAFNQPISNWDVSSVEDFSFMFVAASAFNQPLNSWNVESGVYFNVMFMEAIAFNQNLSQWKLNSATGASIMFDGSGIDCPNYSATIIGWAANPNISTGLNWQADEFITYSTDVVAAYQTLMDDYDWNIDLIDGAGTLDPNCIPAPLPIDLLRFSAVGCGPSVILNWSIVEDNEVSGYVIERKGLDNDWFTIQSLLPTTNKLPSKDYSVVDESPIIGKNFYRLKVNNFNGNTVYSKIESLTIGSSNNVVVYPNPSTTEVNIKGLVGDELLVIYDVMGREVLRQEATGVLATVSFARLNDGTYTIRIQGKKDTQSFPLIKMGK